MWPIKMYFYCSNYFDHINVQFIFVFTIPPLLFWQFFCHHYLKHMELGAKKMSKM